MIDNFTQINSLINSSLELVPDKLDAYYHLQILQRKKENPQLGSNSVMIKAYMVDVNHFLENYKERIMRYCHEFNARAYINISPKSKKATAIQMLNELADCFRKNDFNYLHRLWESSAGKVGTIIKYWVIDCDYSDTINDRTINDIVNFIDRECMPEGSKFVSCIQTKNGKHIITKPFDLAHFTTAYPDIDVHKNNPTVLYIP